MKSPQILELSGIGDPKVLNTIDVPVKIDLPGVGSNIQDHIFIAASFGECLSVYGNSIYSDGGFRVEGKFGSGNVRYLNRSGCRC